MVGIMLDKLSNARHYSLHLKKEAGTAMIKKWVKERGEEKFPGVADNN